MQLKIEISTIQYSGKYIGVLYINGLKHCEVTRNTEKEVNLILKQSILLLKELRS